MYRGLRCSALGAALLVFIVACVPGEDLADGAPVDRPQHSDVIAGHGIDASDAESSSLKASAPSSSASDVLAVVNSVSYSNGDFERFLASARLPGYRPATLAEARRLLEAGLGEALLSVEQARRIERGDALDLDSAYKEIVFEIAGAAAVEAKEGARDRRLGAAQRRAVMDLLLEQVEVEVDNEKLASFVATRNSQSAPPMPPGDLIISANRRDAS